MEINFERKAYRELLKWKQESKGTSAILVEGARRVGKTTLIKEFSKKEYRTAIYIDFNKASKDTKKLFDDLSDLNYIFLQLQLRFHTDLYPRESCIVFDEIQKCPRAREAIKYLVEDGRYDYIESGSLVSIRKNVEGITIPSEEDSLALNPLDYEEFRWALGDKTSIPLLRESFAKQKGLGDETNRQLIRDLRLYLLVGGMPQAVLAYLKTNNFKEVDSAKRKIIRLYIKDFHKMDPSGRAEALFLATPGELAKNTSRFQINPVLSGQRRETIDPIIGDMENSKVVRLAYHANDPSVGMSLSKDSSHYKMFLSDTGLFVTLCFWDKRYTENIIYEKILADALPANLGYVYENLVAQILETGGDFLFYYTFSKAGTSKLREIDFLLSRGAKIVPLEVKSSDYKSHISLDEFSEKFSSRIGQKYVIYSKDFRKERDICYLPFYDVLFLSEGQNQEDGNTH